MEREGSIRRSDERREGARKFGAVGPGKMVAGLDARDLISEIEHVHVVVSLSSQDDRAGAVPKDGTGPIGSTEVQRDRRLTLVRVGRTLDGEVPPAGAPVTFMSADSTTPAPGTPK